MSWLLDTNAWIDYLKNPASAVRARLIERRPEGIYTCSIVRAELLHGARKYGAPERRIAIVREALAPYRSLPFDERQRIATRGFAMNSKTEAKGLARTIC
jgi:tRNA(fMet)-specific endonuclease VapC